MTSKEQRQAHLQWASDPQQGPCFCSPDIDLDLTKLQPTRETIAAIFGVPHPETLELRHQDSQKLVEFVEDSDNPNCWKLQPQHHYTVGIVQDDENNKHGHVDVITPINQIYSLLPGETDDEKDQQLHNFSLAFYDKIWNAPNVPQDFRDKFWSRTSSSEIQAFRQYNWFLEVFGGPGMLAEAERNAILLPKVMAKHTASRMTMDHAVTWLQLMKTTIEEQFSNAPKLQHALGLYWLHFYAFFPYNDEERQEFRRLIQF